jgi:putative ABC transport system permease protein
MAKNAPFDASVVTNVKIPDDDEGAEKRGGARPNYKGLELAKAINDTGIPLDSFSKEYIELRYYDAGVKIPLIIKENKREERLEANSYFLRLSDYNSLMKAEGKKPISLKKDEFAVNSAVTNISFSGALSEYMRSGKELTLNGTALKTTPQNLYANILETLRNQDYNVTFIVDDALLKGLPPARDVLNINYPGKDTEAAKYDKLCKDATDALSKNTSGAGISTTLQTANGVREVSNSATTILTYIGIYIGIIFLIAAAAVLAIGQLATMSDNVARYSLLRKIGTDEKMLHRSILSQNLIYFGAPMALAAAHSAIGIATISHMVSALDKGDIARSSLFVAVVLIIIYGGYFLATYHGSKGILNRESGTARLE